MSASRRLRWGAAVAALATSVALTPAPAFGLRGSRHHGQHHGPSAAAVTRSRREVNRRIRQVTVAEAAIARAKQALNRLNATAEVAIDTYDGAVVTLHRDQRAVRIAHQVLTAADARVASGQAAATSFATAAYETGGLANVEAYLEPGGPAALVSRVGAIAAITDSEHTTLQRLDAAEIYRGVVTRQAELTEANAAAAATSANQAKAAAVAAVAHQTTLLDGLRGQKAHLRVLLVQAKAHATKVQRERLAAIARRRAAAARRRAAREEAASPPGPFSGAGGSTAGTVSAATAARALSDAESQIGKPYQWAATGPSTFDCSGLTMWAYDQVGVHLEHWTHDQWNEGAHVARADLRAGDLVFFALSTSDPSTIHHVGMYVGNGQMVDAPYTGVDVRYDSIDRPDYIGAVRPYQR